MTSLQSHAIVKQIGTDIASLHTLQSTICPIIESWASLPASKAHPFHKIWLSGWKDYIIPDTPFSTVKR